MSGGRSASLKHSPLNCARRTSAAESRIRSRSGVYHASMRSRATCRTGMSGTARSWSENKWRAQRYGVPGTFVDIPGNGACGCGCSTGAEEASAYAAPRCIRREHAPIVGSGTSAARSLRVRAGAGEQRRPRRSAARGDDWIAEARCNRMPTTRRAGTYGFSARRYLEPCGGSPWQHGARDCHVPATRRRCHDEPRARTRLSISSAGSSCEVGRTGRCQRRAEVTCTAPMAKRRVVTYAGAGSPQRDGEGEAF